MSCPSSGVFIKFKILFELHDLFVLKYGQTHMPVPLVTNKNCCDAVSKNLEIDKATFCELP